MSEAPKRSWFRLLAQALFVALTALVVVAVGQQIAVEFQHRPDTDSSRHLPDAAMDILPWITGLSRILPFVLLTSVLCATYAVFRKTGRDLRRMLGAAFAGFLVFVAGLASMYALTWFWFMPAATPPPDMTNWPGTLISLGETTPEVAFTTVDGRAVDLGDLRGQVVLLNFFATWCGMCRMELPELQDIWNEYRGHDDFEMFVIGREESAETLRAFRDEHSFTFPMASDPDRSVYSHFATDSIPRTFVVSRDGKIVYEVTGYYGEEISTLKNVLKQEIGKPK